MTWTYLKFNSLQTCAAAACDKQIGGWNVEGGGKKGMGGGGCGTGGKGHIVNAGTETCS